MKHAAFTLVPRSRILVERPGHRFLTALLLAAGSLLPVGAFAAQPPAAAPAGEPRGPQTWALLINGGSSSTKNYLSHFHHLQDMAEALRSRGIPLERIAVFSADGEDPMVDLMTRSAAPPDFWLVEGTPTGRLLNTSKLDNSMWEGVTMRPARRPELRKWFAGMSDTLQPDDTLLIYVTDHGTRNADDPENGFIALWNDSLSVLEFRAMLGYIRPGVRVVSVMSQCYSGAFAAAMSPLYSRVPSGDVCGFYSSTGDRMAYGCYPEGRDRDRIGHGFRFIDGMARHGSMDDIHSAVLITDTSPDLPVRTSDLFLEGLLQEEASRRKATLEEAADEELARAWKDRARWEPQIRLLDRIGEVYGTFSPRALAELKPRIESLESLSSELDIYADRWKAALDDLRLANLNRFMAENESWKDRLDPKKIEVLDPATKQTTLAELLPALMQFAKGRPDIWKRMQDLHANQFDASSARYRTDVRLAALLRMRAILLRVAGIELLDQTGPAIADGAFSTARQAEMKRALAALEECESTRIGTFDPGRETPPLREAPEPLAPFEEDVATVRRALPSWLGVQFRPLPDSQRESLKTERGAVSVSQVYPDGPAKKAGLEPGDVLLGPPGGYFKEPNQIREWTMTSPRATPLALDILREGQPVQMMVSLDPYPTKIPDLPEPPKAGDTAPALASLKMVRTAPRGHAGTGSPKSSPRSLAAEAPPPAAPDAPQAAPGTPQPVPETPEAEAPSQLDQRGQILPGDPLEPAAPGGQPGKDQQRTPRMKAEVGLPPGQPEVISDLSHKRHMLFFWATWCVPCKSSIPEMLAWSRQAGVPVIAVSDEDEGTIDKFLASWTAPFPDLVASDELRRSHVSYGVSGSPTFVLVDEKGKIEWRQVGYSSKERLKIPGWNWPGAAQ